MVKNVSEFVALEAVNLLASGLDMPLCDERVISVAVQLPQDAAATLETVAQAIREPMRRLVDELRRYGVTQFGRIPRSPNVEWWSEAYDPTTGAAVACVRQFDVTTRTFRDSLAVLALVPRRK